MAERAPQLYEAFWTVGSPSGLQELDENSLFREAKQEMTVEILSVFCAAPNIRREQRTKMTVNPLTARKAIHRMLKLFERSALTSQDAWKVPNSPHTRAIANAFDGAPMERSYFFEIARQTFKRTRELDFSNGMDQWHGPMAWTNGMEVKWDAYGKGEGAVELAVQAMESYVRVHWLTTQLLKMTRSLLELSLANPYIANLAEAEAGVDRMLEQTPSARETLLERASTLKSAHASFSSLKMLTNKHVAERRKKPSLLLCMGDDCFEIMSRRLDSSSAISMMKSCTTLRDSKPLALRMPHLHIRMVGGSFPHSVSSSLDWEDLKANRKRLVTRNFVVKKKTVFLYVDFVQPKFRAVPLKKKPRADGLDNLLHDWSDDEFESDPESSDRFRPVVEGHDTSTDYGMRMHKLGTRYQKEWDEAEGPREKPDRWMFNERVCHDRYFEKPLSISVSLVFADTLDPATSPEFPDGIHPSNRYVANNNQLLRPCKDFGREMPAQCKLHVPLLTSEHGGRRFRLKLTGQSTKRGTSEAVKIVSYSEPFEVVSDIGTIGRATKRKTAIERSAHAREREFKKRRASAAASQTR